MKTTPKDFFLWIGAMVALYVSMFSFLAITFEYINRAFPDALNSYTDPYSGPMRLAIAALAIFFPVFLIIMQFIRRDLALIPEKKDLWIRRWALHFTLFIAGLTIVIDLVTLVNTYLGGDISARFGLKVAMVLLVAAGGFMHFLADLRGYWIEFPKKARVIAIGTGVLVIATIVAGVFIMGTPAQVRLYRFDQQKVDDLTNIQWQVVNYWQQHEKLPATLGLLVDPLSGYVVPADPQTQAAYTYEVVSEHSFKICANFNAETQTASASDLTRPVSGVYGKDLMSDSWWHAAGEVCFSRTIDPVKYPPYSKTNPTIVK